jgi:hypothetical protein
MLVTLLGIVTPVRLVHCTNALFPMLVTLYPPNVAGIERVPPNPVGAVKPVTWAVLAETVYVNPVVASVTAKTVSLLVATIPITINRLKAMLRIRMARVLLITSPFVYVIIQAHQLNVIYFLEYSFIQDLYM